MLGVAKVEETIGVLALAGVPVYTKQKQCICIYIYPVILQMKKKSLFYCQV